MTGRDLRAGPRGRSMRRITPASGAVIKFTSDTEYEIYAQPVTANSKSIAKGTMTGDAPESWTRIG